MPLRKGWTELDRDTVAGAPRRPGVCEFGDADGAVLAVEGGIVRDLLKEELSYGDAATVRWSTTHTEEQAAEEAAIHRDRLSS